MPELASPDSSTSPTSTAEVPARIPVLNPKGQLGYLRADQLPKALKLGYSEAPGSGEAALVGGAQGLTGGHLDEITGALGAVGDFLKHGDRESAAREYARVRDMVRARDAAASQTHPLVRGAANLAGSAALGIGATALTGGNPILGGALAGGAEGLGNAEHLDSDAIKNAALGAGVGAGAGAVGRLLGPAAKAAGAELGAGEGAVGAGTSAGAPGTATRTPLAPRVFNAIHGLSPTDVGAATHDEAARATQTALEAAPELAGTGSAAKIAAAGERAKSGLGKALEQGQLAESGTIPASQLHQEIDAMLGKSVDLNPRMRGAADELHRYARPDRYRQLLAEAHERISQGQPGAGVDPHAIALEALKRDKTPLSVRDIQEAANSLSELTGAWNQAARGATDSDVINRASLARNAWNAIGHTIDAQTTNPATTAARKAYGAVSKVTEPIAQRVAHEVPSVPGGEIAQALLKPSTLPRTLASGINHVVPLVRGAQMADQALTHPAAQAAGSALSQGAGALGQAARTAGQQSAAPFANAVAGGFTPQSPAQELASHMEAKGVGPNSVNLMHHYGDEMSRVPPDQRGKADFLMQELLPGYSALKKGAGAETQELRDRARRHAHARRNRFTGQPR